MTPSPVFFVAVRSQIWCLTCYAAFGCLLVKPELARHTHCCPPPAPWHC